MIVRSFVFFLRSGRRGPSATLAKLPYVIFFSFSSSEVELLKEKKKSCKNRSCSEIEWVMRCDFFFILFFFLCLDKALTTTETSSGNHHVGKFMRKPSHLA